jgi:hypothetical protein
MEMDEKNNFPKITSEQFKYDMGPWLTEKSERALFALIQLRKTIINIEEKIDKENNRYLNIDLSNAMLQLTKIFSFSLGSDYSAGDECIIFDKLEDGLDELKVKYGLIDKTDKQIQIEKYETFIKKIYEYILLEQYPGRSNLQELFENNIFYLNQKSFIGPYLIKIEQELFKAANGELSWNEFIIEAKKILDYIFKINKNIYELFEIKEENTCNHLCNYIKPPLNIYYGE